MFSPKALREPQQQQRRGEPPPRSPKTPPGSPKTHPHPGSPPQGAPQNPLDLLTAPPTPQGATTHVHRPPTPPSPPQPLTDPQNASETPPPTPTFPFAIPPNPPPDPPRRFSRLYRVPPGSAPPATSPEPVGNIQRFRAPAPIPARSYSDPPASPPWRRRKRKAASIPACTARGSGTTRFDPRRLP